MSRAAAGWALLLLAAAAPAQELERLVVREAAELDALVGEQWYGVYFQGTKSGWARSRLARGGTPEAPVYLNSSAFVADLTSNGQRTHFELHEEQVYAGRAPFGLLRVTTRMVQDATRAERSLEPRPGGGGWRIVASVDGGAPEARNLSAFEYTLGDELAASLWVRRGPAPGARLVHPHLEADKGELHTEIVHVRAIEERQAGGVPLRVWRLRWTGQQDEEGTQLLDAQGVVLMADMQGVCEMRLEPEAMAREPGAAADLFMQGQARLTIPPGLVGGGLGDGRGLVRLQLRVTGEGAERLRDGPWQQVEREASGVRVTIDVRAGRREPAAPDEVQAALRDPAASAEERAALAALSAEALRGLPADAVPAERVAKLVSFVDGWLTDAWEPGALTLGQLLERRRGDCTEHAALFVALARAAGIPARTVAGLCWMGDAAGAFGGHAWCEVALGGAWIPVDPTRGQTRIDAGHVRLGWEGGPSGLGLRGQLACELLGAERAE